jgi:hypothetical protein
MMMPMMIEKYYNKSERKKTDWVKLEQKQEDKNKGKE